VTTTHVPTPEPIRKDDPERTGGADKTATRTSPYDGGKSRLLTLEDLDKRTRAAQRAFDIHDRLVAERGGPESMSVLRYSLTRSVAVLSAMVEDVQARWLRGEKIDPAAIATLLNARRREAELIGLDPELKDVTPSIHAYLRAESRPEETKPPPSRNATAARWQKAAV
jgi:hypothetical protein